jgi:hypothetical protein
LITERKMHTEDKVLHDLAQFLNENGVFAQVVPSKPSGSGMLRNDDKIQGHVEVWQTLPGANIFVHGMNYWVTDGSNTFECPIDDKRALVEGLVRMRNSVRS